MIINKLEISFQDLVIPELKRRAGDVNIRPMKLTKCDEILLKLCGVNSETLENLWPWYPLVKDRCALASHDEERIENEDLGSSHEPVDTDSASVERCALEIQLLKSKIRYYDLQSEISSRLRTRQFNSSLI